MSDTLKKAKMLQGMVVSDKMDKTVVVSIERVIKHPKYGKYLKKTTRLKAHDETNSSKTGDFVAIQECRPYAKTKTWKLVEILQL